MSLLTSNSNLHLDNVISIPYAAPDWKTIRPGRDNTLSISSSHVHASCQSGDYLIRLLQRALSVSGVDWAELKLEKKSQQGLLRAMSSLPIFPVLHILGCLSWGRDACCALVDIIDEASLFDSLAGAAERVHNVNRADINNFSVVNLAHLIVTPPSEMVEPRHFARAFVNSSTLSQLFTYAKVWKPPGRLPNTVRCGMCGRDVRSFCLWSESDIHSFLFNGGPCRKRGEHIEEELFDVVSLAWSPSEFYERLGIFFSKRPR